MSTAIFAVHTLFLVLPVTLLQKMFLDAARKEALTKVIDNKESKNNAFLHGEPKPRPLSSIPL